MRWLDASRKRLSWQTSVLRVRAVQKVGAMSALLMSAASGAMEDALIKVVALALVHCKKRESENATNSDHLG